MKLSKQFWLREKNSMNKLYIYFCFWFFSYHFLAICFVCCLFWLLKSSDFHHHGETAADYFSRTNRRGSIVSDLDDVSIPDMNNVSVFNIKLMTLLQVFLGKCVNIFLLFVSFINGNVNLLSCIYVYIFILSSLLWLESCILYDFKNYIRD